MAGTERTQRMNLGTPNEAEMKENVRKVYDALAEKDYNATSQIIGYLLTDDPTYITTYKDARNIMRKVDRFDLLRAMLKSFLDQ